MAHLTITRPPGYYAALAEKWTREKRAREAANRAVLEEFKKLWADTTLTVEQRKQKEALILKKIIPAP